MTTPQQLREWLRKMQYPDPNPSDEALETLCRAPMGPIFQQIIDRVKPKQEVEHTKKAIIVNKLQIDRLKHSSSKINQNQGEIEKLRLYNEKRKLEKQLQEINAQNIENLASLEHLKSKIKSKNAKFQIIKENIRVYEKDIVLFKSKTDNLQNQIESCQKLYEQSKILERTNQIEIDTIPTKMTEVLSKLYDTILSFDHQASSVTPDLTTISEISTVGSLHTSVILSSNKKPLSSIKKAKRANSTRKNLAEITNNYSLMLSTSRKKNLSKISFMSSFNSTVSPANSFGVDKNVEAIKELEQICWNDQKVKKLIDELWESDCGNVFKILFELKEKHKNKIAEMIAQNDNGDKSCGSKSICGLEKLYAYHIQTEMKKMIFQQEQHKIQKMLDGINFEDDIRDITVLKATEYSLQSSIEHARNSLIKLKQDLPDNSEELNQILSEIQSIQAEMIATKSKIDSNLCLLKNCSSWMDKHQNNIFKSIRKPRLYPEYELLKSDIAEQDAQNFVSCPFQAQKSHYFNSWTKIYSNPGLLEIIQCPFLSPDNAIKFFFEQKKWLRQLQLLQKETGDEKLNKSLTLVKVMYDEKPVNNSYAKSVQQLNATAFSCSEILKRLSEQDVELSYFLESSLNQCVAPTVKYEGKTLKEYCEIYDTYFKQL